MAPKAKQGANRAALAAALNKAPPPPPKEKEVAKAAPPPRPKKEVKEAPVHKTKKEIEEEQRQLVKENELLRQKFYEDEASRKATERKCTDESVTYVEDRDTRKPKAINDLSSYWLSDLEFLPYMPSDGVGPSIDVDGDIDVHERLEYLRLLNDQLRQLLKMRFHVFWSHLIFDKNERLRRCLDSYLRFCLRPHDVDDSAKTDDFEDAIDEVVEEERSISRDISRRILAVFVRLSRPQETSHDFLSPERFSAEILEKHIFDVPKLVDICAIYGDSNREVVTKLVHSVFSNQPSYKDEFKSVVQDMLAGLQQCASPLRQDTAGAVGLNDCLVFLPDILSCFIAMFCFFPDDCREQLLEGQVGGCKVTANVAGDSDGSSLPLADLMVPLHDALINLIERRSSDLCVSEAMLGTTRSLLARLLCLVLGFHMGPRRGADAFTELMEWLGTHASDRGALLADLAKSGMENIATDWSASTLADDAQLDALDSLFGRPLLPPEARFTRRRPQLPRARGNIGAGAATGDGASGPSSSDAGKGRGADASASDSAKIREIREVVGEEYGQGFILQCLLHYGGSVPVVVGHVLDGSLAPHLAALPKGLDIGQEAGLQPELHRSLSSEDKRRIMEQAGRQDRQEAERKAAREASKGEKAAGSQSVGDARGGVRAARVIDEYDDDADERDAPPAIGGAGDGSDSAGSFHGDGQEESDMSGEEEGGERTWANDRGKGGKMKGKGKGKSKGPVQGQTIRARRKEASKSSVGNHNRKDGAARKLGRGSGGGF